MIPFENIAAQLERLWGGQTLATLRDEAASQLNGTSFQSLRTSSGPRRILIVCVTGEHELQKLRNLNPSGERSFGKWAAVSLFEVATRTHMGGGFGYAFDCDGPRSLNTPLVFAATTSESIARLESIFKL